MKDEIDAASDMWASGTFSSDEAAVRARRQISSYEWDRILLTPMFRLGMERFGHDALLLSDALGSWVACGVFDPDVRGLAVWQ